MFHIHLTVTLSLPIHVQIFCLCKIEQADGNRGRQHA